MNLEKMNGYQDQAPKQESELFGHKEYDIEGDRIYLNWKMFKPDNLKSTEKPNPEKAIIFTPCWSVAEKSDVVKELCGEFANYSEDPTYAVDTRSKKIAPNATEVQAEAIRKFIEESGFKELTLVGNSIGGLEAINLAALLQKNNPEIKINGLVLLDSLSLYDQKTLELVKNSIKDSTSNKIYPLLKRGETEIPQESIEREKLYGKQFMAEIMKEVKASSIYYPQRLIYQLREMANKNSNIEDIKAPIVLIQGANDLLSNPKNIIPTQKKEGEDPKGYIENFKEREEFLQRNIFKNSPYIRMVVPEKAGHHNVTYCRPKSVAKSSLYMLERYYRDYKKQE